MIFPLITLLQEVGFKKTIFSTKAIHQGLSVAKRFSCMYAALLSRELLMRQFSNHFWYTLSWRNFTTLCEKWLFEKVQLYNCLFWLTSFCQLIQRNCIPHALTWENTLTWYYFIYCDIESCRFLLQPLFDLIYFWSWCLSDVLPSFSEEQHGYIFHICLSDLLTHWPVCSMCTRFVFVLLCNTCLNLREGLNRCSRNTWLMFVVLFWYLNC